MADNIFFSAQAGYQVFYLILKIISTAIPLKVISDERIPVLSRSHRSTYRKASIIKFKYIPQAKADFSEVEPLQRDSSEVEGQDTTEQRYMAMLAHAM